MALQITERGDVVKGVPVVHPTDDLFWFRRPRLILYLIHFVLFQNAFQLAFFAWSWFEFGFPSCFHQRLEDIIIRFSMGILIQVLCSYVTLPLYALVTQMGSTMKPTIFNERVAAALRKWHQTARKHLKENRPSGSMTPLSTSWPATPTSASSRTNLLRHLQRPDGFQDSPIHYSYNKEYFEIVGSPLSSNHTVKGSSSQQQKNRPQQQVEREMQDYVVHLPSPEYGSHQHRTVVSSGAILQERGSELETSN